MRLIYLSVSNFETDWKIWIRICSELLIFSIPIENLIVITLFCETSTEYPKRNKAVTMGLKLGSSFNLLHFCLNTLEIRLVNIVYTVKLPGIKIINVNIDFGNTISSWHLFVWCLLFSIPILCSICAILVIKNITSRHMQVPIGKYDRSLLVD